MRRQVAWQLAGALQRMEREAAKHDSPALARRAALRQAGQGRFGSSPRASEQLLKLIRFAPTDDEELPSPNMRLLDDAMLVAYLVAITGVAVRDPDSGRRASLGRDLRAVGNRHEAAIERVMRSILGADREDLPGLLRAAVSLLHTANQPLAVDALVRDLGAWNDDSQHVQKRWAYDLWAQTDARERLTNTEEGEPS